jgi:hypothetical protein
MGLHAGKYNSYNDFLKTQIHPSLGDIAWLEIALDSWKR